MDRIRRNVREAVEAAGDDSATAIRPVTQDDIDALLITARLRPYQLTGATFLLRLASNGHGGILADEMGLGKTLQTIVLLSLLRVKGAKSPFLVVAPLSITRNWFDELAKFAPSLSALLYMGSREQRDALRVRINDRNAPPLQVIITTPEFCLKDGDFLSTKKFSAMIVDEGHRLKNPDSHLSLQLSQFKCRFRVILTGTPVQNNLAELYALLSFTSPDIFPPPLVASFVAHFRSDSHSGCIENASELHELLEPFLLRRTKETVATDIPLKEEPFELGDHLVFSSAKLILLDSILALLKTHNHRPLIFSQFTRTLDILQDYLTLRNLTYERLDGNVRGEDRFAAVSAFNDKSGDESPADVFLLSTRAGGLGLNLTSADTIIFYDSDFNPQNDLQAAARAHRIGQTRPVKIVRLVSRNTVEHVILKRAERKQRMAQQAITVQDEEESTAESADDLAHVIKVGLDKLLAEEEGTSDDVKTLSGEEVERLIGPSDPVTHHWIIKEKTSVGEEKLKGDAEEAVEDIHVFEGKSYAGFERIRRMAEEEAAVMEQLALNTKRGMGGASTSNFVMGGLPNALLMRRKPRVVLTEAEREERAQKKEEARLKRQWKKWEDANYVRMVVEEEDDDDDDEDESQVEEEGDAEQEFIHHVHGDVTRPVAIKGALPGTTAGLAIVVHCVDDSGSWGSGGVFAALRRRYPTVVEQYERAGSVDDLALGQVHLIPHDDDVCVALMVVYTRDKNGRLKPLDIAALTQSVSALARTAHNLHATLHFPRLQLPTTATTTTTTNGNASWYAVERLLNARLAPARVHANIYYYRRNAPINTDTDLQPQQQQRSHTETTHAQTAHTQTTHTETTETALATSSLKRDRSTFEPHEPPPSPPSSSSFPAPFPLPDLFDGATIAFFNIDSQREKELRRYAIAFGGDVTDDIGQATHVVAQLETNEARTNVMALIDADAEVLSRETFEGCLVKKRRLL